MNKFLKEGTLLCNGRYMIIKPFYCTSTAIYYKAKLANVVAKVEEAYAEYSQYIYVTIKETFYGRDNSTRIDDNRVAFKNMQYHENAIVLSEREGELLRGLHHNQIINIYNSFEENGTVYLVEDLFKLNLLDVVLNESLKSEFIAFKILKEIASAITYLHQNSLLLLSLNPGEIVSTDRSKYQICNLYNVREIGEEKYAGKLPYWNSPIFSAPESHKRGTNMVTPASDVYSLGAILYFIINKKCPPDALALINEDLNFSSDTSDSIRNAIQKAMRIKINERPKSVSEFLSLIDEETLRKQKYDNIITQ